MAALAPGRAAASCPGGSDDRPACSSRCPGRQPRPPRPGKFWRPPTDAASQSPGRPDVVYGFGRIDASGRVADRVTIAALGWRAVTG